MGTSPIEVLWGTSDPDSCSTWLSLRNTLLLMLLVAIFMSVKLSDSNRQHVPLERSPCSSKISWSGDKGYMMETLDKEEPPDDGVEAPKGGDSGVHLVRGAPVEASTRTAKPSTSMMRNRPWIGVEEGGGAVVRSVAWEKCVRSSRERMMGKMRSWAGRKRFRMGRAGRQ